KRYLGISQPAYAAHPHQQLLSPEQERVLIEWLFFYALAGRPATATAVKYRAREMGGRAPGKNWLAGFLRRHPEVRLGKARNLDPKRAQAFNRPVV
ncbi:hypothetical protein K523DRAFT_223589, partial [Schizophyllum commune Tattone D]